MTHVYILQHVRTIERPDSEPDEEVKLIGAYSSEEEANRAIERLANRPGFCDHRDGFVYDRYELNHDEWSEGFFTWDPRADE